MEIWKDIPEYENHYVISEKGIVKSIKFKNNIILKNIKYDTL